MSSLTPLFSRLAYGCAVVPLLVAVFAPPKAPVARDGAAIFRSSCAPCHGQNGKGGPDYPRPLTGTLSAKELARFIHQSMPPGAKHCPAPDADKVAQYMVDAFYSPLAQERNRPARVQLARLTVRQFRNAVADLVSEPHPVVPSTTDRGLHGQYFKSRDFSAGNRVFERTDAEVTFDFGTDGPKPGLFDPHNFSCVWTGSLLAPDTGSYQIVVRSNQAVRLYVNGQAEPLIDAWVKSGNDTEYRGDVFLLAGRAYPIRLEFSKATQGVNDDEKKKGKPAGPAFISLRWQPPKRPEEAIPDRCLFPSEVAPTFVVTAPFPPDDRSIGYERGNAVSKEWDDATTSAALETANYVVKHLPGSDATALQNYCRAFVQKAFRMPLTPTLEKLYVTRQFAEASTPEMAVKRCVVLTLKSPRFLYRDPVRVAEQLSFGLWDTLPDPELMGAKLDSRVAIAAQAERMGRDPRAWAKLREFLLQWLKVDDVPEISRNPKMFAGFDAATVSDLRSSLELFLQTTAWSEASDYRELMLSRTEFLNGRLAKIYGGNLAADAPFTAVQLDPGVRSGLVTNPYLLSRFAYFDHSSPIHRGVLIVRSLLGRTLKPPPAAFVPLAASLHPNLTTRQRVALQTKNAPCNSCHNLINPLGFTLERFDAIGRVRETENGKTVDTTGSYLARDGQLVKFNGAQDLAKYLADSNEAHSAFVEKLFVHLVKQPILAYGPKTRANLERSFENNRYSIRKLMVDVVLATVPDKAEKR